MTAARRAAYVERIVVHGCCSPAVAAQALEITTETGEELRLALAHVVEPRARRRLIGQAASLLNARLRALVHGTAVN